MNVPRLRFKDDDGREFPEWEESSISDMVVQKSKKYDPAKVSDNFKCIELEHLSQATGELLGYVDSRNQKSIKNKFQKGEVLFGKLRPYLRKYLKAPFDGVCSTEIWVLTGKTVSNDFVYQFVQTESFVILTNKASGSKMPRADWNVVASGEAKYPVVAEQTKIANFLTAIDEKITQLTQKYDLLTQYKKGVMQQIFSQKLRFKNDDGREFPGWVEKKLDTVGRVSMCKRILKEQTKPAGDVPFYKIGTFGKQTDAYISNEIYESYKTKFSFPKKGDILISAAGTIGRTVVYDGLPAYFQDSNIVWIDNNEELVTNSFLYFIYANVKWNTENTTIARLYNENLRSLSILVPSLPEQTKIANFLIAIDDKITQAQTQLDAVKLYKKGLLQRMFV